MPRRPRFEIAGVPQHVVQRGNDRMPVFKDDEDRRRYLTLALRCSRKHGVSVHAYVLMGNHVHMLLTAQRLGECSSFMHDLGSMYVGWFNQRHARTGSLWEGRFRNSLVDTQAYLWNCHRYVEFNPVRAGMSSRPDEYSWSSYGANALGYPDPLVSPRPEYLALGGSPECRRSEYRRFVTRTSDEDEDAFARLRAGAVLGSEAFEANVAGLLKHPYPPRRRGRPRKSDENSEPSLILDVV